MKKLILKFLYLNITVLSLSSCGGVIGNIQQYDYNVSTIELNNAIIALYKKHPEWIPPVDNRYRLNGKYFDKKNQDYFLFFDQQESYILKYNILSSDSLQNSTTISLATGAKYGNILRLEKDLTRDEKKLYRQLFEENLLKELNLILAQSYSISNF